MRKGVLLMYGQCVHICPQANRTGLVALAQYAYNAGFPDSPMHLYTKGFEFSGNEICRSPLCKAKLRVGMNISAPTGKLRCMFSISGTNPMHSPLLLNNPVLHTVLSW